MAPGSQAHVTRHGRQLPTLHQPEIKPALGSLAVNRLDTATLDRFYTELRLRGSKCQHCYRRMRNGQPPMRPGEVFRLAFTGKERVHETDCAQGIPMTASAIRDVHAVLSGALQQAVVWVAYRQPGPVGDPSSPGQGRGGASRGAPSGEADRDGHHRGP